MNVGEHLTQDALWEAASTPAEGDDYAHLQLCHDCRLQLDNVKFARGLLAEPPSPPVLSDAAAKRIGTVLRKAAEKEARRQYWWHAWWPFNFSPTWALAPAACALLAFFAYRLTPAPVPEMTPTAPIAKRDAVPDPVLPTPPPMPEAPRPLPVRKVVASVRSTKNAKSGAGVLKKSQTVSEGSTVATAKGGSLLMALPDGSQLGLAPSSQVQLAQLEDKAVTLDVDKGSLKVLARHDATRELRVRAGDLEVIDVGTEFFVTRDEGRTLVAVEEGAVDVKAGGETVPLHAGQAVEWKGGKLERQKWAVSDEPSSKPVRVASKGPAAKLPKEEETPPIPTEAPKAAPPAVEHHPDTVLEVIPPPSAPPAPEQQPKSDDEWTTPGNLKDAPINTPPPMPAPEPPPAAVVPAPPPPAPEQAPNGTGTATDDEQNVSFLSKLQRQVQKVTGAFKGPTRLQRANDIAGMADRRECNETVSAADSWLTEAVPRGESFNLRRSVLSSKLRCLNYQGRTGDAAAVQRELDKL